MKTKAAPKKPVPASELKIIGRATTPRTANNRFAKGVPKPINAGRPKGKRNKTTIMLKEAILEAAALVGSNGKGKDGLVGYLENLARTHKPVYARLLEKVLPMQLHIKERSNALLTPEEAIERLRERGLPVPPSLMELAGGVPSVAHALDDDHEGDESDDNRCGGYERDGLDDLEEE